MENEEYKQLLGFGEIYKSGMPVAALSDIIAAIGESEPLNVNFFNRHKIPQQDLETSMPIGIMTDNGVVNAVVKSIEKNAKTATAVNSGHIYPLEYCPDKECWVNHTAMSTRGVNTSRFLQEQI